MTLTDKVDWNRLEDEGHTGSSSAMDLDCLFSPEGVNIFVQLEIDFRADTTIKMPSDRSAAGSLSVQSENFKEALPQSRVQESSAQYLSET